MLKLPKVPYTMDKDQNAEIPFRGINFSDAIKEGDIADSCGISMRRYPLVTNKRGRSEKRHNIAHVTSYNGKTLYLAKDGNLYYDEQEFGAEEGASWAAERYATINSKVVMMPGKKYIEFAGGEPAVCNLEEEIRVADVVFRSNAIDAGYSESKRCYGGWFDAETKSFRKLGEKTMTCTSMYVGNSTIEPVYKLISNANKQDHIFRFYDEGEFNTLKGLDLTGIRLAFVSKPDDQLSFCGTITAECGKNGEDEYRLVPSENINVDNEKTYDIYAFGVKESNKFFDYLKVGDKFKIGTDSYIVADLSEDRIETEEEMDEGKIFEELVLVLIASASLSNSNLKSGDIIKFKGSSKNTDTYTIKEVQDNKLIFGDDEVIVNEEIPNTVKLDIWVSRDKKVFSKLKEGDAVTVSGCSDALVDNNRTFVIDKIDGGSIYAAADIFKAGNETYELTISRKVPDLDFICEAENRLWGCNSSENTIYISALGDPTNMYAYEGLSTDSFATAVGSPGAFTGCCRYGSSVLFFKEDKIHKILGSYPGDYTLYSYDVEGIQKGSDKSAVVINEVLYYKGVHGIYAYDGGVPTLISDNFGEKLFDDAVAGTDGISYYISMKDTEGEWYLFSYNTQMGIWTLEEKGFQAKDAMRIGLTLYFLDNDGTLWAENAVNCASESEWMMQFTPFYETIQGKKTYSRILLRAEIPQGSYMKIEMRCDGKRWMELGKIVGKSEGVVPIRIPVNRCDKFELRLSGKGEFVLHSMLREFHVGSEV